ncbi:hypothetical protein HanHA300_Chr17g0666941 [Helianthus annuus]|nr:hypothetical protein HanHA300_Chr17g0666941 [Helianthus annuus]KAJ0448686.1 hypothetical protein HanHA89_Chr17g0719811 [Helianthus annuus]
MMMIIEIQVVGVTEVGKLELIQKNKIRVVLSCVCVFFEEL